MIKITNTDVFNFEGAIRGMRNPLNSWDKSDSVFYDYYMIGQNDLALMKKLIKAGAEHRKFMRQILVSADILAPLYFFKEFDTYKVGTVANSCSTMHTIHKKEFTLDDFSHEHLIINDAKTELLTPDGDDTSILVSPEGILKITIGCLNNYREKYLETKDKKWWWQMIQLLPSSYNQKRTWTGSYENLYNMCHQRKNHKLDEWRDFCRWIEQLPYAKALIVGDKNDGE